MLPLLALRTGIGRALATTAVADRPMDDGVLPVERAVVLPRPGLVRPIRDDRLDVPVPQPVARLRTARALVVRERVWSHPVGHTLQERDRLEAFVPLALRHCHDGLAVARGGQVQRASPAAATSPEVGPGTPLLAPVSLRWFWSLVPSMVVRMSSAAASWAASARRAARTRAQTPRSRQRRNRLGASSKCRREAASSRHAALDHSTYTMAPSTVRWPLAARSLVVNCVGSIGAKVSPWSLVSAWRCCGVLPKPYHAFADAS